jgi:hypothetical protein
MMSKSPIHVYHSFATVTFLTLATSADALTVTCVGEAISSRAIGGNQSTTPAFADSAISAKGKEDCFFFSFSSIGRQIAKVCSIRDENVSDEPGTACRVKAEVVRNGRASINVIKRIIKVEQIAAVSGASQIVTCVGTLRDREPKNRWGSPLAIVFGEAGYTCTVDRGGSGHDPLKPCQIDEGTCRLVGTYKEKRGANYIIDKIISVDVARDNAQP